MLSAPNISFDYGSAPVLRGVSMEVPDGGFVGILGPNGSGKTTLLQVLAGTRQPHARPRDARRPAISRGLSRGALARRMAVVPQETHPAFDYTVLEIVLMGRYPHLGAFEIEGPARPRGRARGAGGDRHGGVRGRAVRDAQRRREAARRHRRGAGADRSRSRSASARVLLLDEPTAALDLAYQLGIAALLRELQRAACRCRSCCRRTT